MHPDPEPQNLIDFLRQNHDLGHQQARRIIEEVVNYFHQTPEQFVVERHRQLQQSGFANPDIYRRIADEIPARLFTSASYSERQIRRIIYG